jgi:hypothetical protein
MKRDAIPTPAPAAQSAKPGVRTTRGQLNTARAALLERDYDIADLAELIEAANPDHSLNMTNLVERLHQLGEVELVDGKLGLTDEGGRVAAQGGARQVRLGRGDAPACGESERRSMLLAGTGTATDALTRGLRRPIASAADLAMPPLRPGAEACLELPSRMGNHLHYRSGRITTMDGREIQGLQHTTDYRPSREGRNAIERVGFPEKLFAR